MERNFFYLGPASKSLSLSEYLIDGNQDTVSAMKYFLLDREIGMK
jgi:hypothetical protein